MLKGRVDDKGFFLGVCLTDVRGIGAGCSVVVFALVIEAGLVQW